MIPGSDIEKTFIAHHAGSMGAGSMGNIAEPDTYDWDDSGSEPNQGGHQVKKDKKKRGYEPVKEQDINVVPYSKTKKKPKDPKTLTNPKKPVGHFGLRNLKNL